MKKSNVKRFLLVLVFLSSATTFSQEQEVIYAKMAKEQMNQKQKTML